MTDQKGRCLADVTDRMLGHVPETETWFRGTLKRIQESARFCAPETMWLQWTRGTQAIHEQFGASASLKAWEQQVIDIWMDWE